MFRRPADAIHPLVETFTALVESTTGAFARDGSAIPQTLRE